MHAEMRIGESMVMMGDNAGDFEPMPVAIYLYVPDCDLVYRRALVAGGSSISEVRDMPSGERYGGIKDPCGNLWWVATHLEDVFRKKRNDAGRRSTVDLPLRQQINISAGACVCFGACTSTYPGRCKRKRKNPTRTMRPHWASLPRAV